MKYNKQIGSKQKKDRNVILRSDMKTSLMFQNLIQP